MGKLKLLKYFEDRAGNRAFIHGIDRGVLFEFYAAEQIKTSRIRMPLQIRAEGKLRARSAGVPQELEVGGVELGLLRGAQLNLTTQRLAWVHLRTLRQQGWTLEIQAAMKELTERVHGQLRVTPELILDEVPARQEELRRHGILEVAAGARSRTVDVDEAYASERCEEDYSSS